jgi:hypothetical protein
MSDTMTKRKMPVITRMRFGFTTFIILVLLFAANEANGFPRQARIFPLLVALLGLVVAFLSLASDIRRYRREGTAVGDDAPSTSSTAAYEPGSPIGYVFVRALRYLTWCAVYLLLMYVIGVKAASMLFVFSFLWIESSLRRYFIPIAPVAVYVLLTVLQNAVNLRWPRSLFELIS